MIWEEDELATLRAENARLRKKLADAEKIIATMRRSKQKAAARARQLGEELERDENVEMDCEEDTHVYDPEITLESGATRGDLAPTPNRASDADGNKNGASAAVPSSGVDDASTEAGDHQQSTEIAPPRPEDFPPRRMPEAIPRFAITHFSNDLWYYRRTKLID